MGRARTIRDVAGVCDALAVPFFLVGAFARDLLLEMRHGLKAQRATNDVDFGIRVSGWEEFEALKRALVGTDRYIPDPNKCASASPKVWRSARVPSLDWP